MRRSVAAGLLLVAVGALPAAPILAQSCTITQVSHGPGSSSESSISADGSRVAFLHQPVPGGNNEIFLYDVGAKTVTQLTHAAMGDSRNVSFDAGGVLLAFSSNANLTGANPDGNYEGFLYDTRSATLAQITSSAQGYSLLSDLSLDGTRAVVTSTANLTGHNPDGSREVFLFDVGRRTLAQITDTAVVDARLTGATINADGTRIALRTAADLTGGNADGSLEIFLYDALSGSVAQVTHSTGDNSTRGGSISADGKRIAFASRADLTAGNADGNFEVFLYDEDAHSLTQVTDTTEVRYHDGSLSADGSRIAMASTQDLAGENPTLNCREVFIFDIASGAFRQVSHAGRGGAISAIATANADGTRITFSSNADLTGGGPLRRLDEIRVFLADCPRPTGCQGNATTLCLDDHRGDHRFRARVDYHTAQGGGLAGPAHAVPLSPFGVLQGGLFWFFSAENPEMLLKVINGCAANGHYWVFFSAGTNVGFTVTVTDTSNGHTWTRTNADLHAAAPVQDTAALPCD